MNIVYFVLLRLLQEEVKSTRSHFKTKNRNDLEQNAFVAFDKVGCLFKMLSVMKWVFYYLSVLDGGKTHCLNWPHRDQFRE